jgi:hypothetical protein
MYQTSAAGPPPAKQIPGADETMHPSNTDFPVERIEEDPSQNNISIAIATPASMATVGRTSLEAGPGNAVHTVVPPFASSVCPLDEILHNFLGSRRSMLADGASLEAVVGPTKPSVKKLRNPEAAGAFHSLEGLMSDVLSTYVEVDMPQKMAFFWIMNQTMRVSGGYCSQASATS